MKYRIKQFLKRLNLHKKNAISNSFECYIDSVDELTISGWARNKVNPSHKCHIQLLSKDLVLGEMLANVPRSDLVKLGLEDGCYGYHITIKKELFSSRVMSCYLTCNGIKMAGSDMRLELSPEEYSEIRFRQKYSNQIMELEKLIESNVKRLNLVINDRSFEYGDDSLNVAVGVIVQEMAVISSRLTILESYLVNLEKKFNEY